MTTRLVIFPDRAHRRSGDASAMIAFGSVADMKKLSGDAAAERAAPRRHNSFKQLLPRVPMRAVPAAVETPEVLDADLAKETAALLAEADAVAPAAATAARAAAAAAAAARAQPKSEPSSGEPTARQESLDSLDEAQPLNVGAKTLVIGVGKIAMHEPMLLAPITSDNRMAPAVRGDRPPSPRLMGKRSFNRGRHSDAGLEGDGISAGGSPRSDAAAAADAGPMLHALESTSSSLRAGGGIRRARSVSGAPALGMSEASTRGSSETKDSLVYGEMHRGVVDSVMEQMRAAAPRRTSKAGTARSRNGSLSTSPRAAAAGAAAAISGKRQSTVDLKPEAVAAALGVITLPPLGAAAAGRRRSGEQLEALTNIVALPIPAAAEDVVRRVSSRRSSMASTISPTAANHGGTGTDPRRRPRRSLPAIVMHAAVVEQAALVPGASTEVSVLGDIRAAFQLGAASSGDKALIATAPGGVSRRRMSVVGRHAVKVPAVGRRESISDPYASGIASLAPRRASFTEYVGSLPLPAPSPMLSHSRLRALWAHAGYAWYYAVDLAWDAYDYLTWVHLTFPDEDLELEFRAHSRRPAASGAHVAPSHGGELTPVLDSPRPVLSALRRAANARTFLVAVFLALGIVPMACAAVDAASGATNLWWLMGTRAALAAAAALAAVWVEAPSHAACAWCITAVMTSAVVCRLIYGLVSVASGVPPLVLDGAWIFSLGVCLCGCWCAGVAGVVE
jgi:hypothetical protein